MEVKKGEASPPLDGRRRGTRGEAERGPEIKGQGNLATHEGTFRPPRQGERILPPPEKGASCKGGRAFPEHPGGEEELAPPDGGWGWLVAFGAFVITVSAPPLKGRRLASFGFLPSPRSIQGRAGDFIKIN